MIVKIRPLGRSFSKLALYLSHDPKHAETSERLDWTYTLNCAHNHVSSAVHEMYTTWLDGPLLKQQAGVRAGGRRIEKPVKHYSLSWHPSEKPTREDMIAAVQSHLKHLGFQEHQAVLFCHNDTPHPHVHVMLSTVSPVTGLKLDDRYDRSRTRDWAAEYELSRGKVFCAERLKPAAERQKSPPRNVWERLRDLEPHKAEQLLQAEAERELAAADVTAPGWKNREWRYLKTRQYQERMAFFAGGKEAYRAVRNEIYQQVRQTYRREWAEYFSLKRAGAAPEGLAAFKSHLVEQQNVTLDHYRDAASLELRRQRDLVYRGLLDRHTEERAQLADRQERGLGSFQLWIAREAATAWTAETAQAAPPPQDQPSAQRGPVDIEPGRPWTHRGGMAPQERAADRWLARAAARLQPERKQTPQPQSQLEAARARQQREKQEGKQDKGVGVEPDPG